LEFFSSGVFLTELFRQNATVETAPLQDEIILFNPQQNKFCMLNKSASFIWTKLKTPASAENLARELRDAFCGVTTEQALEDTKKTLDNFVSLGVAHASAPDSIAHASR
jgi:hypothetical protein